MKVQSCILKAAIAEPELKPDLSDEEWKVIKELLKVLQPLKLGVEALRRHDATLLSAERVFSFILETLEESQSDFGHELLSAAQENIQKRRMNDIVSLLKYQNDTESLQDQGKYSHQRMPSHYTIEKTAVRLLACLYPKDDEEDMMDSCEDSHEVAVSATDDLTSKLEHSIKEATSSKSPTSVQKNSLRAL